MDKSDKKELVIAEPDVTFYPIVQDLKYILLACDGLWDVASVTEVDIAVMSCFSYFDQSIKVELQNEK